MRASLYDPFGAAADSAISGLALALDPDVAKRQLKRGLPRLAGENGLVRLRSIRVVRHKPAKRAVIEYDVLIERGGEQENATIIGKIRSRRFGNESFRLVEQIWNAGFNDTCADGVSVPEPLGVIPELRMWCQRKVAGVTSDRLLNGAGGGDLARKVAGACQKLHRADIPSERKHTMADELRILHECLDRVVGQQPALAARIRKLEAACDSSGAALPDPRPVGIHRDFYGAQVIVADDRLFLIDFDLFCLGDPGLDIGNFIAHITEQSLRERGDASALAAQEQALEDTFVALSGEATRPSVRVYTTLSLARHVYLSTQFPERRLLTESLLKACEKRLGIMN